MDGETHDFLLHECKQDIHHDFALDEHRGEAYPREEELADRFMVLRNGIHNRMDLG
jgi:hypothetical protein